MPEAAERSEQSDEHSRQSHSAHHTEHVTVHYPWHPLHGQTILVQRSVRHSREVWLCEPDERTAAIPVWMTDRVACAARSVVVAINYSYRVCYIRFIGTHQAYDRIDVMKV